MSDEIASTEPAPIEIPPTPVQQLLCPRCGLTIDDTDNAAREVSHGGDDLVHRWWHRECFAATFGVSSKGILA